MRIVIVFLVLAAACTKKNPEACCTEATDCMNVGLPDITPCNDGLLCRGNRCVEVSCEVSAQCDLLAPYCVGDLCDGQCAADDDCPGFGQNAENEFCVTGACVECREGTNDCDSAVPICSAGTCRRCEAHQECPSGACDTQGLCVPETSVAYVTASGSTTSNCTRAQPCDLARALGISPAFAYLQLASGTYQFASTLSIVGQRTLIGAGSVKPRLTNAGTGPVIKLGFGAELSLDNLEITGAKNGLTPPATDAYGVECPMGFNGILHTNDTVFSQNQGVGIRGQNCTLDIRNSTFISNGRGISTTDVKATIERSLFTSHTTTALYLDGGLYAVTNNFIFRNAGGIELYGNTGSVFEFNTIADNTNIGFYCQAFDSELSLPNNLLARNGTDVDVQNCTLSNSILGGTNIEPLKFKRPDSAPYDYHLQPGSSAIDIAGTSSVKVDFDGEARPAGTANDIGADELH